MATLEQLQNALVAADKAGNADDARALAQQIKAMRAPSGPATTGQEIFASPVGAALKGAVSDPAAAIEQGVPRALSYIASYGGNVKGPISDFMDKLSGAVDANNKHVDKSYDDARAATSRTGFDFGRLTGNILSPANFAVGAAASKLPVAATLLGKVAQGAGVAATDAAVTQPVEDTDNYGEEKLKQIALAAGTGGLLPGAAKVAGKILNPSVSADAKTLLDKGVRLTPGQILGGAWKGAEDKISSVPFMGSFVSSAQHRSIEDFNRAIMDEALKPIGVSLPKSVPVGRDAVAYVANKIGDVYDTVLPKMTGQMDAPFVSDLKTIVTTAQGQGAAQHTLDRLQNVVKAQLFDKVSPTGLYSGDKLKEIQSEIGRLSAKYGSSENQDDRALGDMLGDVHGAFRDMLSRNNPQHIGELTDADAAWAQYARIRRAASALGAKDGIFSGPQFANAVKASDRSVGKGNYAKGIAFMQDLSDPAKNVLPSSVPDSGTAGRLMMAAGLGGTHFVAPHVALPLAALTALYTKGGTKVARSLLTSRPGSVRAIGAGAANANPALMSIPLVSLLSQMSGVQQGN